VSVLYEHFFLITNQMH